MTPLTYKLIAHDGRVLGEFANRYDADRALFAVYERAAVYVFSDNGENSIVNDNHDVWPLEPEVRSEWTECRFTMPGRSDRYPWRSEWLMCSDGEDRFVAAWFPEKKLWETKRECPVTVSHWQELPPLP